MIARILTGRQMTTINQLSAASSISDGDQFPIFASGQGDARRVPASLVREYIQSGLELSGGILAASGLYVMVAGVLAPNLTNVYANIAGQDPTKNLALPTGAGSLAIMAANGEFIATRDIQAVDVNVNIAMTYTNARQLTLAILTGPDTGPYETPLHFSALGQAAVQMYANFRGLVYNPNNANGIIREGEKIRLVAKYDVAGPTALAIQSLSTQIQTLDGV